MKKVINGKMYDTDTDERLVSYRNGYSSDINLVAESLHRARKGQFFVYGRGGAYTEYAQHCGSERLEG